MLAAINWNVDPEIFPNLPIRWYGLFFAIAFYIGFELLKRMFKREGHPLEWADTALMYALVGTVVGARLGHVFFYDWAQYSKNPIDILKVWEGGLASHGAVVGMIVAFYIFSRRVSKKPLLWILDRVVITVAQGGFFVRMGNLMNSEIYGKPTNSDWGFIFERTDPERLARYPTQLIEAGCYLLIFIFLWHAYRKTDIRLYTGRLFGYFLALIFGVRFLVEFLKENQVGFEDKMVLNMGQLLSIPCVIAGLVILLLARKKTEDIR